VISIPDKNSTNPLLRQPLQALSTLLVVLTLVACSTEAPPQDRPATPELNLETLEAETAFGTLRAERAETSFVAPLGEGQAIGITFLDGASSDAESQEIFVRLYHRELAGAILGELDAEGKALLTVTRGDLSEFDATVALTITGDVASGTVTLMGESNAFTTAVASGVAGVYEAWGTDENPDTRCQWVVLPDERQWGCICLPPFISLCCRYHYF
jgi:hypothetical protein